MDYKHWHCFKKLLDRMVELYEIQTYFDNLDNQNKISKFMICSYLMLSNYKNHHNNRQVYTPKTDCTNGSTRVTTKFPFFSAIPKLLESIQQLRYIVAQEQQQ